MTREENVVADTVVNLETVATQKNTRPVPIIWIKKPSHEEKGEVCPIAAIPSSLWMKPIFEFLISGQRPEGKYEAAKIECKATKFHIIKRSLYRK